MTVAAQRARRCHLPDEAGNRRHPSSPRTTNSDHIRRSRRRRPGRALNPRLVVNDLLEVPRLLSSKSSSSCRIKNEVEMSTDMQVTEAARVKDYEIVVNGTRATVQERRVT